MKMDEFSYRTRRKDLETLDGREFPVLVIGGGIIGAGVANTLSQCGVQVLLVDKGDFASGTSSGSSKMIHGGLRYLSQGRIRLTRSLLKERNYLLRNTAIVKELDFTILIGKGMWPRYQISMGLLLYRILGGGSAQRYSRNKGEFPEWIRGYFRYKDAVTDDAVLTLHNIIDARSRGAVCLNYVAFNRPESENAGTFTLTDVLTGQNYRVKAGLVINCAGSWARDIIPGLEDYRDRMKMSKGIHLIFPGELFKGDSAVVFRSAIDRRQLFLIPRGEVVIVGTTDDLTEDPDDFIVTEKERQYIVESLRPLFPAFTREKVISEYAGIRSLFGRGDNPGKMSRDFRIIDSGRYLSVIGGKVTDYRRVSAAVARSALSKLSLKASTRNLPVIGRLDLDRKHPIRSAVFEQCAITEEDVVRRRTGAFFFSRDAGRRTALDFRNFVETEGLKLSEHNGISHINCELL